MYCLFPLIIIVVICVVILSLCLPFVVKCCQVNGVFEFTVRLFMFGLI